MNGLLLHDITFEEEEQIFWCYVKLAWVKKSEVFSFLYDSSTRLPPPLL
jgi:hypothetical protein